jgi:hypothetical protein
MPANTAQSPASGQTVSAGNSSSVANPFYIEAGIQTGVGVSVSVPTGYLANYS